MSTSLILVSEVTETDAYDYMKMMFKTALLPFLITCVIYTAAGFAMNPVGISAGVENIFAENFSMSLITLVPALIIIVFSLFKISIKKTMIISIAASSLIALFIQHATPAELVKTCIFGFQTENAQLS